MSSNVTKEQKAYHLKKMKTRFTRMDINKDGYISREDYELMAKRMAEYGNLTKEQAESVHKACTDIADMLNFKPGDKFPVQKAVEKASEALLSKSPSEAKATVNNGALGYIFDVIDLNKDGHISRDEMKVYFNVLAPEMTEEQVNKTFDIIDTDKNGEISREEFLQGALEFFFGVEQTELSDNFFGPLLD